MQSDATVAKGVAALYFANITTLVLNTVFLVLLTNFVLKEEVGFVSLLNVVVVSAATISVLALPVGGAGVAATPPAVTRFLSRGPGSGQATPNRVYLTSLAACAVISGVLALLLSVPYVSASIAGPLESGPVFFAGIDAVVFSFAQLGAYSMLGTGAATKAGKLIIASSAARYLFAAVLLVGGAGPSGVFIGFAFGDAILAVLGNVSSFRYVGAMPGAVGSMKPVLSYMASVFLAALVGLAVTQTDKLLAFVSTGLSYGSLALYNVATVGAAVASFAPAAATNVLVPALGGYGALPEKKKELLRNYTRHITLVAAPMGFGLAAISPFLLRVFGDTPPNDYTTAAPVMALISISIAFTSISSVYSSSLLVDDRAHHFSISSILALLGLVGVAFALVPSFGLLGIALGRAAMLFIMLASVAYFVWRSGTLVLDAEAYLKSLGSSALMGVFVFAILTLLPAVGLPGRAAAVAASLVMLPIGLVFYVLVMKSLRAFNQSDVDFIEALLPEKLRVIARVARWLL